MSFAYPALLLLLWTVPLMTGLWVWMRRRNRRRMTRISLASGTLAGPEAEARFRAQLALAASGTALALIALARPRWGERQEIVHSRGRNVVLAVDVSRSMLAEDVRPNRLERARADLRDLLDGLQGDRAALLAFRGNAVLICPLTTDMAFLRHALEGLTIDSAPRGETHFGNALEVAMQALEPFPGDHNAILLISDGEDLSGRGVNAARKAGDRGIPVFTVGIGDTQGASLPLGNGTMMRHEDELVISRLDPQTLLDIATASGGAYIPLQTSATGRITLGTLYQQHLRNIAARELEERMQTRKIERFQVALAPAILCFLFAAFLSPGRARRRRLKPLPGSIASVLLMLCSAAHATANNGSDTDPFAPSPSLGARDRAREAQAAFRSGHYAQAATGFLEAANDPALDPRTQAAFRFNAAVAQLRKGSATQAAETFRSVLQDRSVAAGAGEGLAAALYQVATQPPGPGTPPPSNAERLRLLDESAMAFQESVRERPGEDRPRHNLAAAASRIPPLRGEIRLEDILDRHGQTPPEQLLVELLRRQRAAYETAAAASTNRVPDEHILRLEESARLQREASDLWIPLAPQLLQAFAQSVTNPVEMTQLQEHLLQARDRMRRSAEAWEDLDASGLETAARSEEETLQLLAAMAPPPLILEEAIFAQTNTLREAHGAGSPRTPAQDQENARALTDLFQERFPGWAEQITASTTSADAPSPLTPETRKEIERLAHHTLELQARVLEAGALPGGGLAPASLPHRTQALDHLIRIRELLPQPPSRQTTPPEHEPPEPQPKPDESGETPPESQDRPQEEEDTPDPEESPPEEEEESGEQEQESAEPEDPEEPLPPDLEALMERVLQREREREEDRRRRIRKLPPLTGERDW